MEVEAALEQVGDFGRFQALNYLLLCLPVAHTSIYLLTFVFTARDLPYRCFVPGCDDPGTASEAVRPAWVQNAVVPGHKCLRYARAGSREARCGPEHFSNLTTERCDRWVFPAGENTIVSEFEVTCEESKWKITIVGSMIHIGQFVGTPICGLFSDRFGRRALLLVITGASCLLGMLRSLAPSYGAYIALVFLDAMVASGMYTACFILGVELVASRQRVLAGSVVGTLSVFGFLYLAMAAWLQRDWRGLLRVVYAPAAVAVLTVWLLPESVRWLASRGRLEEAEAVLARVVRVNRVPVSAPIRLREPGRPGEAVVKIIKEGVSIAHSSSPAADAADGEGPVEEAVPLRELNGSGEDAAEAGFERGVQDRRWPVVQVFRSPRLACRFAVTAAIWMTNTFVYFGLAIRSVSLAGDIHLNFALSALVEVPAYVLCWVTAERWGRRAGLSRAMALTAAALLVFTAIPADLLVLRLALYFTGKLAITASFTTVFVFTAELFPTSARHSMLGLCSTAGRVGSVLATQTPLLEAFYWGLPVLLFGLVSLFGSIVVLLLPETLNKPLPDTVLQAERVGSREKGK